MAQFDVPTPKDSDDGAERRPPGRVEGALTVGGKGRGGRLQEATAKEFARCWVEFAAWCRSERRRSLPATPETLAIYADHLVRSLGYARSTARKRLAAVRWKHRVTGHAVPDDVAAWAVLRDPHPTPATRTGVKVADRMIVAAAAATCDPFGLAGRRDRCLLAMIWHLHASPEHLLALNVEDILIGTDRVEVLRYATGPAVLDPDPQRELCPVVATEAWIADLAGAGVRNGALFRPIDRFGTIGGTGIRRAGPTAPGGRLSTRSVIKIWARYLARSAGPVCTPHAVKVGGARDAVHRGVPLAEVLRRGGWVEDSDIIATLVGQDGGTE